VERTQRKLQTRIGIAFRTANTAQNIVKPHPQIDKYGRNGVYRMKCMDCPQKCVQQTGRTFYTRYKEHIQVIRNNINSGYWNHILSTGHTYGNITDTVEIGEVERKGKHLTH
jgi:hypothetical protein